LMPAAITPAGACRRISRFPDYELIHSNAVRVVGALSMSVGGGTISG